MKIDKVMSETVNNETVENETKPVKKELPPKREKPEKRERPPKQEKVKKEKPPKKEKPIKEKPPKKEKPIREKPVKKEKPVKEKTVKEKPVKKEKPAKAEKVISYRNHWWEFWKPKAPKVVDTQVDEAVVEEEVINDETSTDYSYVEENENILEPIVSAEPIEPIQESVETFKEPVRHNIDLWESKVTVGGFNTTLKGYVASLHKSCTKILEDSTALNLSFGSAVNSMVDYKKPAFVTEMERVKKGSLVPTDALYPISVETNDDGSFNVFSPLKDEYLKNYAIMVGVTIGNTPYISQVFLHKNGNTVYGRFPSKPSVIAMVVIKKDFK